MCPLVPTLNCVKLKDYLLVPVTIHTICMVLFMPTKTVGTHAATCDRVVLVYSFEAKIGHHWMSLSEGPCTIRSIFILCQMGLLLICEPLPLNSQ